MRVHTGSRSLSRFCGSPKTATWPILVLRAFVVLLLTLGSQAMANQSGGETKTSAGKSDDGRSIDGLRTLAAQGHAWAQFILGVMHTNGKGVPEDDAQAVRWFRLAAAQGDAKAQTYLGFMYMKGEGTARNYVEAYAWLDLAGAQGLEGARQIRDICTKYMTSSEVAQAQQLSRQ